MKLDGEFGHLMIDRISLSQCSEVPFGSMLGRRSRNCDTIDLDEQTPTQLNSLKTRKLQDPDLQQFKVDPLRYDKNKLDFLPLMQINKYLGEPILIDSVRKPLCGPVRSASWTLVDLRVFLEKYFVY